MAKLLMGINGAGGPFTAQIADLRADLQNLETFLDHIADTVVYPALVRNYNNSGLRGHGGVQKGRVSVRGALTTRGAPGNVLEIHAGHLMIGVDYGIAPAAKFALEGRRAFRARPGKVLRFWDQNGKPIFTKHVKASPAHEIYYLTDADVARIQDAAVDWIAKGG